MLLLEKLNHYKNILTIEEHCLDGGFGSIIAEAIVDNNMKQNVNRLGLPNKYYFENGGREYLLDKFGLSHQNILEAVKSNYKN